jgi:hypothetical protein
MNNVNKSHHLYKPDSECSPITLIMRKYYKNESSRGERYDRAKKAQREKYANNEEYREQQKEKKRAHCAVKRAEQLEHLPVSDKPPPINSGTSYEKSKKTQREKYANNEVYRQACKTKNAKYALLKKEKAAAAAAVSQASSE